MRFNKLMTAFAVASLVSAPAWAQTISGKVVDENGRAIANAEIHLDQMKTHVFTDSEGKFKLLDVKEGLTELHVSAKSFNHYNQKIDVTSQEISGLEISLNPTVMEIIDVHATPLHSSSIESALPINVLASDELRLKQASTLGETLKNEVGVHSSYYGPVSSSPIIRGMDGPRVLISQNGLDVGDASRVGADHVVAAETSTATQIEVLRGPATLFYGSGAIGGVVNVVDNRVPTNTDTTAEWQLQHNNVADENEASINLNFGHEQFAFHVDGFWRESNDYDIPGFAEAGHDDEHHDEHEEDHDEHEEEHHEDEHEEESGTLENSASKSSGYTLGSSYILDNGYIGFSYGRLDREYGIPGHSHGGHEDEHEEHEEDHDEHEEEHHEDEHEERPVYAKLKQDRFQMISDIALDDAFLSRMASKLAYTDYQHQEIEDGEVGTTFENESLEARVDLYHREVNGFNGAWTLHYKTSDFSAEGEEAFTPPTETTSIALAWLEEKHYGDWLMQLGFRYEHVSLEASDAEGHHEDEHEEEHHDDEHEDEHEDEHDHEEHVEFDKQTFNPVSASLGLVWNYKQGYNLGFSTSFSQRAPSGSELFANGPHIGTNTFEVGALYGLHIEDGEVHADLGEQDVELETSYNFDITWRKFEGDFGFVVSAFYNHIEDYYYQQDTGLTIEAGHDHGAHEEEGDEEGLPVFIYRQDDVDMYGIEAELVYQVSEPLKATIYTDFINAELSDGGDVPRIPPMRIGGQLNYQTQQFAAELSVSHYFEQDNIAQYETETDSYTMIDANFNYYLSEISDSGWAADTVIFVKGRNLTDEDARVHSSFLKDVAPLPGRGLSIGIRGSF